MLVLRRMFLGRRLARRCRVLNCLAIQNGAISAVVWFYLPPGGQGTILGFSSAQYPSGANTYSDLLYVGPNGYLYGLLVIVHCGS